MTDAFELVTELSPKGDQPRAIAELTEGLVRGDKHQVLLGITGSGKTFTIAQRHRDVQPADADHRAEQDARGPALRRDAASSSRKNAVEYFVSYYDYYQPEAYIPSTDTYIEKDAIINDQHRPHAPRRDARAALATRRRSSWRASRASTASARRSGTTRCSSSWSAGRSSAATSCCAGSSTSSTSATTSTSTAATFRVRGDVVEIFPAHSEDDARCASSTSATRSSASPRSIRSAARYGPRSSATASIPGSHYVTPAEQRRKRAIDSIREELGVRLRELDVSKASSSSASASSSGRSTTSRCSSRWASATASRTTRATSPAELQGEAPPTLVDYFPDDYLLVLDESHQTVPQLGAMFRGDRSRKETLVEHGFRLPSALDNRPLKFEEIGSEDRPGHLRERDARRLRGRADGRRRRGAGHPTDGADGPGDPRAARRSEQVDDLLRRDPRPRRGGRARARARR